MRFRRSKSLLAIAMGASLLMAACGSDEKSADTAAPVADTAAPAADTTLAAVDTTVAADTTLAEVTDTTAATGGALAGVCPETMVLQTDWMPEAEHGFVYQMIGEGYEMDKAKGYVTGPLIDATGADTGVKLQIRSGGAAQNFDSPSTIMYNNEDTFLAYVYTDEAIQNSANKPSVAIESGFNKNPQMIMWDPTVYPDVQTIADLGKTDALVRYFAGGAYMDYLTGSGILKKDQVDGSYSGDPSLFVTDEGKAAQQGFGSAEPYLYENVITSWLKPVKFQYINDIGWENYAESIATKPENIAKYADCFKVLVPIIQQASVDYINDPTRATAIILDAVAAFGEDFGWVYDQGTADYAVKTIKGDGLVANGADGVMGKFDMTRVADLITKAVPLYTAQDSPPKDGLTAEDIVTNEFIDDSIHL
ncbi:MAG: ABC transporter substrate-binding protein [Ilumatobacteraceae bacterium]